MTTQEQLDFYYLVRQVIWRYKLDGFEAEALKRTLALIRHAKAELLHLDNFRGLESLNQEELLAYFDVMTASIRTQLANDLQEISAIATEYTLQEMESMLSIDGLVSVNKVALSPEQLSSFFGAESSLPEWVNGAWGATAEKIIKNELDVGVLKGEGYQKLVGRLLEQAIDEFTERDAVRIARTYVQTANVAAQFASYEANDDIVKGWIWSSVLEPFDPKTGGGTCLACSALDGQKFELNQGPRIPLHISCRCVARPWVKSWRELGVDKDEISEALRPYTIREGTVGAGGMREIQEVGRHQGSYKTWFEKQSPEMQERILGPGRYALYSSGQVRFEDFIDKNGRLLRLDELDNQPKSA